MKTLEKVLGVIGLVTAAMAVVGVAKKPGSDFFLSGIIESNEKNGMQRQPGVQTA